jgi:CheY-like chemotaxis protein
MIAHPVPPKLLLVDDRPANLLALEAVLGDSDYQLLKASSGNETLAALEKNPDVALILLDVQMPVMDGFEVSRRIKQTQAWREIPIIFITAFHTENPFVLEGYKAGAVDWFSKPFDPEILKLKVSIYASFRHKAALLRERELQLRESEELLRTGRKLSAVLESLPHGVLIADHNGRVCQMNQEVLRLLNCVEQSENNAYGEFFKWWETDGHLLRVQDGPLMRAMQGLASHNEIIRLKCLDGTPKSVFASASALHAMDRHVIGAVLVLQDVTARRQIQADFERRVVNLVSLGIELEETAAAGRP